jgi:hypothetical protein
MSVWQRRIPFYGEMVLEAPEATAESINHKLKVPKTWIKEYFVNSAGKTLREVSSFSFYEASAATAEGSFDFRLASEDPWSVAL